MALGFIVCWLFYSAVAAAAGRLDDEHVACGHLGLVERSELAHGACGAQHIVASRSAGFPAFQTVRAHEAMPGENRRRHRFEEAHAAHRAVPAAPAPGAARAVADLEALEPYREAPFEHLGIGEARIRHVGLDDVCALEARPGARAA